MFEMQPLDGVIVIIKAGNLVIYQGSSLVMLSFFPPTNIYFAPIFQGSFEYQNVTTLAM